MIVCGLKLTHDGAVAVIENGRLLFSVEMEKLDNNRRYSAIDDLASVARILHSFQLEVKDVDEWVIDGWDGNVSHDLEILNGGKRTNIRVGPYRESDTAPDVLKPAVTGKFRLGPDLLPYTSHSHVAGHLASAYYTSSFAVAGEPAAVLVWDAGLFPQVYWVDPELGVEPGGALFPVVGHVYAEAALHFGPFRVRTTADQLGVAGKLMAYIALGKPNETVLEIIDSTFEEAFESDSERAVQYRHAVHGYGTQVEPSLPAVSSFFEKLQLSLVPMDVSDEDVLATIHLYFEKLLVSRLEDRIRSWKGVGPWNLCFAGGCALNIKWNSALRASPMFRDVWVPPFPNDSGSALGAACLGMRRVAGMRSLEWNVRLGPHIGPAPKSHTGWVQERVNIRELAAILHRAPSPIILLEGRAELGPRALGGRSIIASASDPTMKDELNRVKRREPYRPVAPLCLEEFAADIFDPGTPDPYMLFDHVVRPGWESKIPAVVHLDGTARLQTVSSRDEPKLAELLSEYYALSGIPVLCNTSANRNGSGFFPDVASAMEWGQVDAIWSDGILYTRRSG